jgi:hypothetical protein
VKEFLWTIFGGAGWVFILLLLFGVIIGVLWRLYPREDDGGDPPQSPELPPYLLPPPPAPTTRRKRKS